jgi:hypothetical protein
VTAALRWSLRTAPELDAERAQALLAHCLALVARRRRDGVERTSCGELDLFLKGGPLRGESRLRHGLRAACRISAPPRWREFDNLRAWAAAGIGAAAPLAAGVAWRAGLPVCQWLATATVPGAVDLAQLAREAHGDPGGEQRVAAARSAGARSLARLHRSGRRHGDAHPRNLLVGERGEVWWIDAWRYVGVGRGPLGGRAARRDLDDLLAGCADRAAALAAYREECARIAP